MQARMNNPVAILPDALQALLALHATTKQGGIPEATLELTHLRASQINGCSACIDIGTRNAKRSGESDQRLYALAAWHDSPLFTEAERAALGLAEAMTRLSDRSDPVPDEVWQEAARHYDQQALAALILSVATTNAFNRINVTVKQMPGEWG